MSWSHVIAEFSELSGAVWMALALNLAAVAVGLRVAFTSTHDSARIFSVMVVISAIIFFLLVWLSTASPVLDPNRNSFHMPELAKRYHQLKELYSLVGSLITLMTTLLLDKLTRSPSCKLAQ